MFNTKKRNQKITHLVESVVRDHCRIYKTVLENIEDGVIVLNNDEPLYYLGIEFNDDSFDILFNGFVFSDLSLSKVIKLREIYREDTITEFLKTNGTELGFYEDEYLIAKSKLSKKYKDYSILQTAFTIIQTPLQLNQSLSSIYQFQTTKP